MAVERGNSKAVAHKRTDAEGERRRGILRPLPPIRRTGLEHLLPVPVSGVPGQVKADRLDATRFMMATEIKIWLK
jgi:hypothetical protein